MTLLSASQETVAPVHLAKYIDLGKWEHNNETHYQWQGYIDLARLPRVWALRDDSPHAPKSEPLAVKLLVEKRGAILHWQLATIGTLWQTCQRCLEPVAIDLSIDSHLALLEQPAHAALLEEYVESMLLEEIADDNKLWLSNMIEDELLVALPLSPKHANCEMAVHQVGELPEEEEQENPFAMLAGLKGKLSS